VAAGVNTHTRDQTAAVPPAETPYGLFSGFYNQQLSPEDAP